MRFRFNPEPWPVVANATRRNASTTAEVAILAVGTALGGTAGAILGRSRSAAGVGAGLGLGVAIALVVTAMGDDE